MASISFKRGDVIRNKGSGNVYVVLDIINGNVIAARTVVVTNPSEWEKPIQQPRTRCHCGKAADVTGYCEDCLGG